MQISIGEALQIRLEAVKNNNLESQFKIDGKEYNKKWADAVEYFREQINKERTKDKMPPLSFIAVRQKLIALKEIDDLRWFYFQCLRYKNKKKGNTFSKCFFGALKTR
ncbi:MAG: hypothetical protein ABIR14_02365 [Candidatus Paceibacterota bacterium]